MSKTLAPRKSICLMQANGKRTTVSSNTTLQHLVSNITPTVVRMQPWREYSYTLQNLEDICVLNATSLHAQSGLRPMSRLEYNPHAAI